MTASLLAPLVLPCGLRAPNRVWLAAMTNLQSHEDGSLSDDELRWLELRAEGGFGVVTTCAAYVGADGQAWKGELGIYDDALLPGLRRLAILLQARGAVPMVQLFHGGVRAASALTGVQVWSASEFEEERPGFERPRAATEADIARVIDQFRDAAMRAERAGFGGVELHGAHGYLLSQFLSRAMNTRADRWGGTFENRARLLRETLRAVRGAVAKTFAVGVRVSPEDFGQARGLDLDETLELAGWLAEDGADFFHASLWDVGRNTTKRPSEHPIPLLRAALPARVPLVVAGKVWTKADGERALGLGADAVALARSAIANPDWPRRIADPAWEPKRPPLTPEELRARGLSDSFTQYMRNWKGFVTD